LERAQAGQILRTSSSIRDVCLQRFLPWVVAKEEGRNRSHPADHDVAVAVVLLMHQIDDQISGFPLEAVSFDDDLASGRNER